MTSDAHTVQGPSATLAPSRSAEAARYALLRRLAPSIRHHLVVNLQPIGMVYEIMDRRLKVPHPDLENVHESAQKINEFARAALHACLDVVSWLAPQEEKHITAAEGVRECLGLLATSLTFRGYALRNDVAQLSGEVRRSAIRNVLTAAMIHATDETPPAAELVLGADTSDSILVLTLTLQPTGSSSGFATQEHYRQLEWADVQALAESESVTVAREGRQLRLSIPWAA